MSPHLRSVALIAAASIGLSACAYDDGYGYGGLSVGYHGGYYDPWYDGYYGGYYDYYDPWYAGGWGYPSYFGWYRGFYYPGIGFYIYDRYGKRHRWDDHHRRYWESRRGGHNHHQENWTAYRPPSPSTRNPSPQVSTGVARPSAPSLRPVRNRAYERQTVRAARPDRASARSERASARPERVSSRPSRIESRSRGSRD